MGLSHKFLNKIKHRFAFKMKNYLVKMSFVNLSEKKSTVFFL